MNEITSTGTRVTPASAPAPESRAIGSSAEGRKVQVQAQPVQPGAAAQAADAADTGVAKPESGTRNDSDSQKLEAAVARLNDYAQSIKRELQFSIDGDTGKPVVRVLDGETQELVRQMPSDLALSLAKRLEELGTPELVNARI